MSTLRVPYKELKRVGDTNKNRNRNMYKIILYFLNGPLCPYMVIHKIKNPTYCCLLLFPKPMRSYKVIKKRGADGEERYSKQ